MPTRTFHRTTSALSCNLCDSLDADVVSEIDREGRPLRSVICRACGLVRTDPMVCSGGVDWRLEQWQPAVGDLAVR